jgi:endo-1,4-beta-xylanase
MRENMKTKTLLTVILSIVLVSCAPVSISTPTEIPIPTATKTLTPAPPTPTITPIPALESLPETQKSVNQFVNAMQNAGINVTSEQILQQGLMIKEITGVDGKRYEIVSTDDGYPLMIKADEGWQGITPASLYTALGKQYGVEALAGGNDAERFKVLKDQFNQMTITALSWKRSQPAEGTPVLEIPQAYLEKALINGQTPTFQHLVYGNSTDIPDSHWLRTGEYSKEDAIKIMQQHITDVMVSNRIFMDKLIKEGKVTNSDIKLQYIVVNEGVNEPSYYWVNKIGHEYIELAFQTARLADPKAVLLYNDFGHEMPNMSNVEGVFSVVKNLKDKGLIDGVGMQMHFIGGSDSPNSNLSIDKLEAGILAQMKRYEDIGVDVYITELDVDLSKISGTSEEQMKKAGGIYRMISKVCTSAPNCKSISVFGMNSDSSSWIADLGGKPGLLFFNNKPLYTYYSALAGIMDGILSAGK